MQTIEAYHAANTTIGTQLECCCNKFFSIFCCEVLFNIQQFWYISTSWCCKYHTCNCFLQVNWAIPSQIIYNNLLNMNIHKKTSSFCNFKNVFKQLCISRIKKGEFIQSDHQKLYMGQKTYKILFVF